MEKREKIQEIIVVEGKDDTRAVLQAVDAETAETHGFGLSDSIWPRLSKASESGRGIIILTDPDHAGESIRKKVMERFPDAKNAFLPKSEALKKGDIGVENASPEAIREALSKARASSPESAGEFQMKDLISAGLSGRKGSRSLREKIGNQLGIGYANVGTMLRRLNCSGISREEFYEALRSVDNPDDPESV